MPWWENFLISFATSVLTILATVIINGIVSRNRNLKIIIKSGFINNTGYFQFDIAIFNPAKIPQCYDTLNISFFSGGKKIGTTRLETTNQDQKTKFGEFICAYVNATTLQPKAILELSVKGSNNLILNSETIKIEYHNMATFLKKRQLKSIKFLNKDTVQEILQNNKT